MIYMSVTEQDPVVWGTTVKIKKCYSNFKYFLENFVLNTGWLI